MILEVLYCFLFLCLLILVPAGVTFVFYFFLCILDSYSQSRGYKSFAYLVWCKYDFRKRVFIGYISDLRENSVLTLPSLNNFSEIMARVAELADKFGMDPSTIKSGIMKLGGKKSDHGIPADVLRDASKHYKQTAEARKTVLPETTMVFRTKWARMVALGRQYQQGVGDTKRHLEKEVTKISGTGVQHVPLPIESSVEYESADDRLTPYNRANAKGPNQVYVGALEVVIEGYASMSADTVVGATLTDSRHGNPQNALRGAFLSSINASPFRVLFFPGTRIDLTDPHLNDALTLSILSPNNDMYSNSFLGQVRVGMNVQFTRGSHQDTHTHYLMQSTEKDHAAAVKYAKTNCVVVHARETPRGRLPSIKLPLKRQDSMVHTGPLQWERSVGKQEYVEIGMDDKRKLIPYDTTQDDDYAIGMDPDDLCGSASVVQEWDGNEHHDYVRAQAPTDFLEYAAKTQELHNLALTQRTLMGGTAEIPTNVVAGIKLVSINLKELLKGKGALASMLWTYGPVRGKLMLVMECSLTRQSGIGIGVAYHEAGLNRPTLNVKTSLSGPSTIWNPATEGFHTWSFSPFSCSEAWTPAYLDQMQCTLNVFCVSAWIQPPLNTAALTWAVYYSNESECVPRVITPCLLPAKLDYWRCLGNAVFKQGTHALANRFILDLGKPVMRPDGYTHIANGTLLAMHKYWEADLEVELTRLSSPLISATLCLAVLPGTKAWSVNQANLMNTPHVCLSISEMCSRTTITIPKSMLGVMLSTDKHKLGKKRDSVGAILALWVRDSVTALVDGDLVVAVRILSLNQLSTTGFLPGFPNSVMRAQQVGIQELHWCKILKYEEDFSNKGPVEWEFDPNNPLRTASKIPGTLMTGGSMARVLETHAWVRGKVWYKVLWQAKRNITNANWKSTVQLSKTLGVIGTESILLVDGNRSGEMMIAHTIEGPLHGFYYQGRGIADQYDEESVVVAVDNVEDFAWIKVFMGFDTSLEVAGMRHIAAYTDSTLSGLSDFLIN